MWRFFPLFILILIVYGAFSAFIWQPSVAGFFQVLTVIVIVLTLALQFLGSMFAREEDEGGELPTFSNDEDE